MAAKKRQCVNCWFYRSAEMSGYGWCEHPERQQESSARLMVRNRELACRNSWGNDLFVSKDSEPAPPSGPSSLPPNHVNASGKDDAEDTVTSVTTPLSPASPGDAKSDDGGEDRVVSDRPSSRPDNPHDADDGLNDAARIDQEERARVIARGNGDAIASARARYFERRRQGRSADQASDPDTDASTDDPSIPVDASTAPSQGNDTGRVVSQQERLSHRFTRNKASETYEAAREEPVPRSEVEQHHAGTWGRFDSVPEIDPTFDLPGWRRGDTSTPPPIDVTSTQPVELVPDPEEVESDVEDVPDDDQVDDQIPVKTYEHVLNRARRIRDTRKPPRSRPHLDIPATVAADHSDVPPAHPTGQMHDVQPAMQVHDVSPSDSGIEPDGADSFDKMYKQRRAGSVQGDTRRSWLARFAGDRGAVQQDHGKAEIQDSQPNDFADARRDAIDNHAEDEHLADGIGWNDDPYDNPAPPLDRAAEAGDRWAASQVPGHRLPDHHQPFADDDGLPDSYPSQSQGARRGQPDLAQLPDIDALFSASFDPQPAVHDSSSFSSESPRPSRELPQAAEETHGASRRWSPDAPYTPRDSFFRARRFSDWEEEPDRRERNDHHFLDDDEDHHDYVEPREPAQGGQLPDLDADSFDLRDVISRGSELLDMTIDIAPGIPRECRTCRSFRSADGGARGWCTNEWAFTHRRMVNEDDLACETAIGSWWLPADRYWMPEEDIDMGNATPLMDAFLRRFGTSRKRKVSGQ